MVTGSHMKTNVFMVMYPGHGGGNWFTLCTNNPPAGMSVLLEFFKDMMLDLEERGLDPRKDYDSEGLRFLEYRTGKDACVGIIKGYRESLWKYMESRGGHRLHVIRNPLALIGKRWGSRVKDPTSVLWNQRQYGRKRGFCQMPKCLFLTDYLLRFVGDWVSFAHLGPGKAGRMPAVG